MSQMEVIRSEGPLKKDWEVTYRAGLFCDECIVIEELKAWKRFFWGKDG